MINRHISKAVRELGKGYPAIAITGPRQSGKTTLLYFYDSGLAALLLNIREVEQLESRRRVRRPHMKELIPIQVR